MPTKPTVHPHITRTHRKRPMVRICSRIGILLIVATSTLSPTTAEADQTQSTLPVFVPHPSDWRPDTTPFPYNLWQNRVTSEQVDAERESCQWFMAQYDQLMGQVVAFQQLLGDQHDIWEAAGVTSTGAIVLANLEQSARFLDPRAHALYITNYPDRSQYSPLFQGDSFYHLWYQFTQIADKMNRRMVSGVINANVATANVYGNAIRDSAVCRGA